VSLPEGLRRAAAGLVIGFGRRAAFAFETDRILKVIAPSRPTCRIMAETFDIVKQAFALLQTV
jgi:hypothetical protein